MANAVNPPNVPAAPPPATQQPPASSTTTITTRRSWIEFNLRTIVLLVLTVALVLVAFQSIPSGGTSLSDTIATFLWDNALLLTTLVSSIVLLCVIYFGIQKARKSQSQFTAWLVYAIAAFFSLIILGMVCLQIFIWTVEKLFPVKTEQDAIFASWRTRIGSYLNPVDPTTMWPEWWNGWFTLGTILLLALLFIPRGKAGASGAGASASASASAKSSAGDIGKALASIFTTLLWLLTIGVVLFGLLAGVQWLSAQSARQAVMLSPPASVAPVTPVLPSSVQVPSCHSNASWSTTIDQPAKWQVTTSWGWDIIRIQGRQNGIWRELYPSGPLLVYDAVRYCTKKAAYANGHMALTWSRI